MNFPALPPVPDKKPQPLEDNIRNVVESILTKLGKSRFEIAEIIREFEQSESDQLTLYDAQDIETCEQLKF